MTTILRPQTSPAATCARYPACAPCRFKVCCYLLSAAERLLAQRRGDWLDRVPTVRKETP